MKENSIQILKYVNTKVIIFSCVFVLAVQALNYISAYSINLPLRDDWSPIFAALYFQQHDPTWINAIIAGQGEHLQYFYRFIMMVGFLLNSFNVQSFMYLNWGLLSASIGIIYTILRRTDEKIIWLIIPIAALVYNPKLLNANLVAAVGLSWIVIFFFLVSLVSILNKKKITKIWLSTGIALSIIATFNVVLGLLSWIIGIFFLVLRFNENKKNLLILIVVSIIICSLYISIARIEQSQQQLQNILGISRINWALEYVSNPYSIPSNASRHLFGAASIISLISISAYFIIKRVNRAYPWIIFGSIGILSTILTTVGRFQVRFPSTDYYIIMSNFTQIALLVLVTILFFEIRELKNKKWNKMATGIYIIFIIGMMILLIPTYYHGYHLAITRYDTVSTNLNCFKIPSDLQSCMTFDIDGDPKNSREKTADVLDIENTLIERKVSLFSSESFFIEQKNNINRLEKSWNALDNGLGLGDIFYINDHRISNDETVLLNDSHVFLSGWIDGNDHKINQVVLFVDGKPFLSSDKFLDSPQLMEQGHFRNGTKIIGIFHPKDDLIKQDSQIIPPHRAWAIVFFPAFLEKGCHKISVGGINGITKFTINKEFILCKNIAN